MQSLLARPAVLGTASAFSSVLIVVVMATLVRSVDRWLGETTQILVVLVGALALASLERFTVVTHRLEKAEVRRLVALGVVYGMFVVFLTLSVLRTDIFYSVSLCLSMSLLTRATLRSVRRRRHVLLARKTPWWVLGLVGLYVAFDAGVASATVGAVAAGACHGIAHSLRTEFGSLKSVVITRWQLVIGSVTAAFVMLGYDSHPTDDLALFPVVAVPLLAALHFLNGYVAICAARYPTRVPNALPLLVGVGSSWLSSVPQRQETIGGDQYLLVAVVAVAAVVVDQMVRSQRYVSLWRASRRVSSPV